MTFRHRAGVSPYTSPFGFAETCVFDKQSPGPLQCDHLAVAPLIPKLRGQYAEFLNNPSPVGLRILSSSTCVGLRYGRPSCASRLFSLSIHRTSLLNFSPFRPGQPTPGFRLFNMSACLNLDGYGISTVCASTTPFGLALAPGLPVADEPTHGNLRFSAITILTQFSLLIPAFSLECSPHVLPVMLHPAFDAPLPIPWDSQASVICFSPVESSAQHHSTSELLRTL